MQGLAETRIYLRGGRQVRLAELGEVVDNWEKPRSFARLDGRPVVAFSIYRSKGASDTTVADRAADLTLLSKTLVPREGAPPTYARALLEAMREKGYQGTEQDLGYLLKTAFRAHPAVKKAKRGKKGVRWEGLAAAETRRTPG